MERLCRVPPEMEKLCALDAHRNLHVDPPMLSPLYHVSPPYYGEVEVSSHARLLRCADHKDLHPLANLHNASSEMVHPNDKRNTMSRYGNGGRDRDMEHSREAYKGHADRIIRRWDEPSRRMRYGGLRRMQIKIAEKKKISNNSYSAGLGYEQLQLKTNCGLPFSRQVIGAVVAQLFSHEDRFAHGTQTLETMVVHRLQRTPHFLKPRS
ncbi:hypothetical protein Bca4012_031608 [Brassica carinata]